MGMGGKEVGSRQRVTEVWHKEGGKHEIKGEDGFDTMGHVKGRVASGLASGGAVCPENERCKGWPLGVVACTCFDQGFMNGMVLAFDDAIGSRVVDRSMNVMDPIFSSQPVQCGNVGSPVISNDLLNGSPSAQNLFENEGA